MVTAIIGVRDGCAIQYVSVRSPSVSTDDLADWAPDQPRARALLAFGPLSYIGTAIVGAEPDAGFIGSMNGDDEAFIEHAAYRHHALVIALHAEGAGGWRVWNLTHAFRLRAIEDASAALGRASEITNRALELLRESTRMKPAHGARARREVRDTARLARIELDRVHRVEPQLGYSMVSRQRAVAAQRFFSGAATSPRTVTMTAQLRSGLTLIRQLEKDLSAIRGYEEEGVAELPTLALSALGMRFDRGRGATDGADA